MEQDKIVIEHLNLWYGSFQALKDINWKQALLWQSWGTTAAASRRC